MLLLPHRAFTLQIRQNLVRKSFAQSLCSHMPHASAKLAFPLQPHRPPLFCLISSEAVLLTEKE
ncbi:MAG TPA: hypothetical protein VK668_07185, partial [Mucilaginibacter sp.]|nr:hypothetical protein [Mucilaginibacter sp.]